LVGLLDICNTPIINLQCLCLKFFAFYILFYFVKVAEDVDWKILKPEIFATIMDFFASGLPIMTDAQKASDTGNIITIE